MKIKPMNPTKQSKRGPKGVKKRTIAFRIPEEFIAEIQEEAIRQGRSINSEILFLAQQAWSQVKHQSAKGK